MSIIDDIAAATNFFDLYFINLPKDEWPSETAQRILRPWWGYQGCLFL